MRLVIVLDTNIFVSHRFGGLILKELAEISSAFPNSRISVSEVVLRELESRFHEKCSGRLKSPYPLDVVHVVTRQLSEYWQEWRQALGQTVTIDPVTDELLRLAYERTMLKSPPCHQRDEFRDAIIWQTVLQTAEGADQAVFITDNTRDFPFGENRELDNEARESCVYHMGSLSEVREWAEPVLTSFRQDRVLSVEGEGTPASHEALYDQWDLVSGTAEFLEDHIEPYLRERVQYYDADPELIELYCRARNFHPGPTEPSGLEEFSVEEVWEFDVAFSLSGIVHMGGRDGVEFHAAGSGTAHGSATIWRGIQIENRDFVTENISIKSIELHYDGDWDPYEAMLRGDDD